MPAAIPGVHLDLSLDGGSFVTVDGGFVQSPPAGVKQVRFRGRLETLTDDATELLGLALKVDAS
jgi:hypothetical protein